jgi:hypothetical protein
MWEPVAVDEWVEDLRQPAGQTYRVWYTQVRRLDAPDAPAARTACGLYTLGQRPCSQYDDVLCAATRRQFWFQYTATGAFPCSTWDEAPFATGYRHRYHNASPRRQR